MDGDYMAEADKAREYLAKGRYREAGELLDQMLISSKDDDELWYLRGVVSLKLKSYDAANESFERALSIRRKAEYFRTQGMAFLEMFEIEDAIHAFESASKLEPRDAVSRFFLGVCFMMMDDPRSADHLREAIALDPKRTKSLLSNFYSVMFGKDKRISEAQKKMMMDKIGAIA